MTVGAKLGAGVAVLVLVAAGVVGWTCRGGPPPVASHVEAAEASHVEAAQASHVEAARATATTRAVRSVVTTEKLRPDGTVAERRTATTDTATTADTAASRTTDATAAERIDAARQLVRDDAPSAPSAPRLRLALVAEWSATHPALVPTVRAEGRYRLAAPVFGVAPWAWGAVAPPVLGQGLDVRGGVELAGEW